MCLILCAIPDFLGYPAWHLAAALERQPCEWSHVRTTRGNPECTRVLQGNSGTALNCSLMHCALCGSAQPISQVALSIIPALSSPQGAILTTMLVSRNFSGKSSVFPSLPWFCFV